MKRNGFVFVESIIVLVVVGLSLTVLISSYSLISRKTREKERYDKASDKYFLYALSSLGVTDECNYAKSCSGLTHKEITFRADRIGEEARYACNTTKIGEITNDCESLFKQMKLVHVYVIENIINDLNDYKADGTPKTGVKANEFYDNGTIEYLKTLKKCNDIGTYRNKRTCLEPIKYMVGVFERGNKEYYYASIEI